MTEQEKQSRKVSWHKYNKGDTRSPLELMAFDAGFTAGIEYQQAELEKALKDCREHLDYASEGRDDD